MKRPWASLPWFMKDGELESDGVFRITIDFDDAAFPDMRDSVEKEWGHLSFFQYPCVIKARIPRVKDESGKTALVSPPWKKTVGSFVSLK